MKRRSFLIKSGIAALGISGSLMSCRSQYSEEAALKLSTEPVEDLFFKISLAQWSLHKSFWAGKLDNLDFASYTAGLGIKGLEYVNQFFMDKAKDTAYLGEMKKRATDLGLTNVLIMIDAEGNLAGKDEKARIQAVENHYKWVEAAKFLGCHAIRVNAAGKGKPEDTKARAIDSLSRLCEYASQENINVLVENHGGYSSDASWLAGVMKGVNRSNCGTLPDFGNFIMNLFPLKKYDRYQGMEELMPFAKGVSAKSHDFNEVGEDVNTDFKRVLKTVKDVGYTGFIGIEYEGYRLSEKAGILATKALLERVGKEVTMIE